MVRAASETGCHAPGLKRPARRRQTNSLDFGASELK